MTISVQSQYQKSIRKTIVSFGDIFNNISLTRTNADGTTNQTFAVPIIFAPKEKYLTKLLGDPNLDKKVQISLPRMSYDLEGLDYDSTRKQITNIKNTSGSPTSGNMYTQYVPVPYNFDFSLSIYVRNIEDGTEIVERILPFFTPSYTIKINYVPELNMVKEVPILLDRVEFDFEYEGDTDSTRVVIWTLHFTAKAYIFGPLFQSSVIKEAITNLYQYHDSSQELYVTFNLSANGFGYFKQGETAYQGYSLETALATGTVKTFSNTTNQITLTNVSGQFLSNTYINGETSQAAWIVNSLYDQNNKYATIDVKVNPITANANSNYTITTDITEY